MPVGNFGDFAVGELLQGIDAAATTVRLRLGHAERFLEQVTTVPFYATIWQGTDFFSVPDMAYWEGEAERVLVTAITPAADAPGYFDFTITRGQGRSGVARSLNNPRKTYFIRATLQAVTLNEDIPNAIAGGGGGGGSGTVTSVSVTSANGVSGSVTNATTTPAIELTLGAINPGSVNGITLSGSGSLGVGGSASVTGTNTGDQTNIPGNAATATYATTAGSASSATTATNAGYAVSAGTAGAANQLTTPRNIGTTGDVSFSLSFDGSANASGSATLANSGATAGAYTNANITIDAKGRVTAAANGSAGNVGTVTSVGVTLQSGITGNVANGTSAANITLGLGNITPTGVASSGTVTGTNLSGTNTGDQTSVTGNAGTATKLATARNINGQSFDGTADITITTISGNAGTATKLATPRTINGTSFDGSGNITVTAAGSTLSDTVTIAKGGTGATTADNALTALGGTAFTGTGGVVRAVAPTIAGTVTATGQLNMTRTTSPGAGINQVINVTPTYAAVAGETAFGVYSFITNNGSATPNAGDHLVGVLGRAGDTTSGKHMLYGAESRVDASGTAAEYGGHFAFANFGAASFAGTLIGNFVRSEIYTNTSYTTPLAQGLNIGTKVSPLVGGATKRSWVAYDEMQNQAPIGAYNSSGTTSTKFSHDGTDGAVTTSTGRLILQGATGNYVPAGTGTGRARIGGALSVNTTVVGNITGGQDDLMTYTLPGGTLAAAGDTVKIRAAFNFATNANTKTAALLIGASVLYSIIAPISGGSAPIGYLILETTITRKTATTCIAVTQVNIGTDTVTQGAVAVIETLTETLSGNLIIKGLGESAASATNDVRQVFMAVEFSPAP